MRATMLWLLVAVTSLAYAQDSLLKSVEPDYGKYSPHLVTDFDTAIAPVTVTVAANGKPFAFNSIPLPMAAVMALKDYEFTPYGAVPHGRPRNEGTYEVTLNVPIRQSTYPIGQSETPAQDAARTAVIVAGPDGKPATREVRVLRPPRGVTIGLVNKRVQPIYPEAARNARIQGTVTLEAMISKQGDVEILRVINGPFALIEPAFEAVKQWEYRPYLLNREPVEVLAEIEVVFHLD